MRLTKKQKIKFAVEKIDKILGKNKLNEIKFKLDEVGLHGCDLSIIKKIQENYVMSGYKQVQKKLGSFIFTKK